MRVLPRRRFPWSHRWAGSLVGLVAVLGLAADPSASQSASRLDASYFVLERPSAVRLETTGSSADTRIRLYNGSWSPVGSDDDGGVGTLSRLDFTCGVNELPAGIYYVEIDGGGDGPVDDYELLLDTGACAGSEPDIEVSPLVSTHVEGTPRPLYVELDWMTDDDHDHRPSQEVIDRIVATFRAAGYAIHIDVSNAIPHQEVVAITGSVFGSADVAAIRAEHFDHADDSRYFYSLWVHNYSYNGTTTTSSGVADFPGRVHLVSLGSFHDEVGTAANQIGTFIHELGHNLSQSHGGGSPGNYKPTYLSVMNYHYQLSGIGPALLARGFAHSATGFDDFGYSHGLLASLDENDLDEHFGIGLGRPVDWDCDGVIESSVATDIQALDPCEAAGSRSVIGDYDNWSEIADYIRRAPSPDQFLRAETCMTREELAPLEEQIRRLEAAGLLEPADRRLEEKAAGSSFVISNTGSDDLLVSDLALDAPAPWIQWAPQAPFTVASGESQEVFLSVDFDAAPSGQSTRRLVISSNDPDESPFPAGVDVVVSALPECALDTGAAPTLGGTTAGDVTAACGTTVTALASAAAQDGYAFESWTEGGAVVSTEAEYTFTLDANRSLVANFVEGPLPVALFAGEPISDSIVAEAEQAGWKYYFVDLPPGSTDLVVELYDLPLSAPQDADLFVRFDRLPNLENFTCRSILSNGSSEQCTISSPAGGRWWIGVNNWHVGAIPYSLRADWVTPASWIFGDGFESGDTGRW